MVPNTFNMVCYYDIKPFLFVDLVKEQGISLACRAVSSAAFLIAFKQL